MYKYKKPAATTLIVNESYIGETIEEKVRRIMNNKEPIKDGSPQIFTDRKDGVRPELNIRTDRFEIAIEAMDKVDKTYKAKREERQKDKTLGEQAKDGMNKEENKDAGGKPIQGTGTGTEGTK